MLRENNSAKATQFASNQQEEEASAQHHLALRGRTERLDFGNQSKVSLFAGWLGLCVLALPAIWVQGRVRAAAKVPAPATDPTMAGPASAWAEAAVKNEVGIIEQEGSFSVRYRERKVDARGDTTRMVIQSKQGAVARLIERNGKPISAAEDTAERARLQDVIDHPDDFYKHHRRDSQQRHDASQIVQMMPTAMLYSYAPGQPQRPDAKSTEVVLDFQPNPEFHPPSMMAEVLTGVQGRIWIDPATQHVVRAEGRVLRPINFGLGMVAKLYPGGTLALEQTPVGGGRWVYSDLEEHLTVRALMVKTIPQNLHIGSSEIELLPGLLSYQDAIRTLLAMPFPSAH